MSGIGSFPEDYARDFHKRYVAKCVGGPYDGQMFAWDGKVFEVAQHPPLGRPTDPVDIDAKTTYGRYDYVAPTEAKWVWRDE